MLPPEQNHPIVYRGTPNVSMKCSFTIITVSADVTKLQFWPSTLSVDDATAKPRDNIMSFSTPPVVLP